MNDKATEGVWYWVDGNRASANEFAWAILGVGNEIGQRGSANNCGLMSFVPGHQNNFRVWDITCSSLIPAFCEKLE